MVLKAYLLEAGYADETRYTVDIDANWYSATPPTGPQMVESLEKAIRKSGLDLKVGLYRMYGEGRSAGFELIDKHADKLSAISTDKVFRRIKDVVDLYYISKVFPFDKDEITRTLENSGRKLDTFSGFLHRQDELKHSYEKFRFTGDVTKPPFEEVYRTVRAYVKDVLPREKKRELER